MARQNYQHGKRQRELAKKQKQDEKLQRKLERKNNPHPNSEADDATMPVEGDGSALESATEESEGEP